MHRLVPDDVPGGFIAAWNLCPSDGCDELYGSLVMR